MSAGRLAALPGGQPDPPAGWEPLLRASVRPEFQVEVYLPEPGDPVLFGSTCAVAGCDARGLQRATGIRGYFCQAHAVMWRRDGQPPQQEWVREGARGLRRARPATACAAAGCRRSAHTQGLCQPHYGYWRRAGRPPLEDFVVDAPATRTGAAGCLIAGCAFPAIVGKQLCDAHHKGYRWLRWHRGVDLDAYLEHLQAGRERGRPRFELRGVGAIVALELGYALQCRQQARGAAITPLIFAQVVRWLRERPVDSLLIGSDVAWARAAEERFSAGTRANPLAWVRYCRRVLGRLRDQRHEGEVWDWDTWPTDRIDPSGRYSHQRARRIYFADIEPGWLRALAKRWARWRITTDPPPAARPARALPDAAADPVAGAGQNPDGERPFLWSALNNRLQRWLADCDVRDAAGRPVRVTAHQFRHTVGTRMINNEVPMDTVQRMLDHASPEMTARYATIKDQTLRREWERFQQRINIAGELVPLPGNPAMSDAAWALENLARAKQTLANGYCGLPLQQTCPHPNACLTCDSFLTTAEFLPQHRDQLGRTEQLIAQAEADGRQRLVEINEPVRLNLIRIIDGLAALEDGNGR